MSVLQSRFTRFRAYQLGNAGSSFSYFDGNTFTLLEARLTDLSRDRLWSELEKCGNPGVGCLHITSWDQDHCAAAELDEVLNTFRPPRIEYPGYLPASENGIQCRNRILQYKRQRPTATVQRIDPGYIRSLTPCSEWGYRDILYHPTCEWEKPNDNSTVKLFRTGCFNVLSLGDVENCMISARLRRLKIVNSEIDVMILAHHGADNGFTTAAFLKAVRPRVAVCSSDYDNKFDHPRDEIRDLLHKHGAKIYTTKTGDVIIRSLRPHTDQYQVVNLQADSTELSSVRVFATKKSVKLRQNIDTVRQIYQGGPHYRKLR